MANSWTIGASGTGKTTLLIQRALADKGFVYIDPHGDDTLLLHFPKREALVIDPILCPVGWNILQDVSNKPLVAALIRETIRAVWGYSGMATPVMDRVIYNSVAALLDYPGATLLDLERLLTDRDIREQVIAKIGDPVLKGKWEVWATKHPRDWDQLIQSTVNKAGEFSEDPRIRAIIGSRNTFDLKDMLFKQQAIILRLPQAELGEQKVKLFGSLFLAHLLAVASARHVPMPYSVYLDDAFLFDTPVLRNLLSHGRRYGLSIHTNNQYLAQLSPELRSALIGNSDERIMFRCGIEDSETIHRTIPFDNTLRKLHQLHDFEVLIAKKSSIENRFTSPLYSQPNRKRRRNIVEQSNRKYGLRVNKGRG